MTEVATDTRICFSFFISKPKSVGAGVSPKSEGNVEISEQSVGNWLKKSKSGTCQDVKPGDLL